MFSLKEHLAFTLSNYFQPEFIALETIPGGIVIAKTRWGFCQRVPCSFNLVVLKKIIKNFSQV